MLLQFENTAITDSNVGWPLIDYAVPVVIFYTASSWNSKGHPNVQRSNVNLHHTTRSGGWCVILSYSLRRCEVLGSHVGEDIRNKYTKKKVRTHMALKRKKLGHFSLNRMSLP